MIERIDHVVMTVRDIAATCDFYSRALGMQEQTFGDGRRALAFGDQKINLHQAGAEFEPKAERPTPGSVDVCFLTRVPLEQVIAHLTAQGIAIFDGPVIRAGALGPIRSVYLRDPDQNLIDIANRADDAAL